MSGGAPHAEGASIRDRVRWAERAARSSVRVPSLYSVSIEFDPATGAQTATVCGFQHERRGWLGQALLDVCQVQVIDRPDSAVVSSSGTFKRRQYREMAAIKEFPFPPRPLDLSALRIEPGAALARMRAHVQADGHDAEAASRCLGLILTLHEGALAWQGVVDLAGIGVHTVALDAGSGAVLFHQFDRYHPG